MNNNWPLGLDGQARPAIFLGALSGPAAGTAITQWASGLVFANHLLSLTKKRYSAFTLYIQVCSACHHGSREGIRRDAVLAVL